MMTATLSKTRQQQIGLALAGGIGGAWLTIHIGGIFFWDRSPASVPYILPLVMLQCWLSTGLFIVAHDAMHGALAPGQPRLNRVIGALALGMYAGLDYRAMAPQHAAHHRHVGTADDPDFHVADPRAFGAWFVAFFRRYYTHAQIGRITLAAILYMVLGASLLNIAVFWAIPALLALAQLFYFGTYLPHRHDDLSFPDHHRARSVRLSPLASLLTCFNFGGYHHEHHLSPATAWWQLPAFRRARDVQL